MTKLNLIAVLVFVLGSCADKVIVQVAEVKYEIRSELIINEYAPKGILVNAKNEAADWVELKNTSEKKLIVGENEWSLTDDTNEPDKYFIPKMEIGAGEYILIWCDKESGIDKNFHANFKLSGNGERITLLKNGQQVDQVIFDQDVKKGFSYGRSIKDADKWLTFDEPTPGEPNLLFDNYAKSLK